MILDEILARKKQEVEELKTRLKGLTGQMLTGISPTRDFKSALIQQKFALIAEVKRSSPSAGVIIKNYDPVKIAQEYKEAGASAISVLTDKKYFGGDITHLWDVKTKVNLPVLRKDFIIDEGQIYESRIAGADAILLIVRILSDEQLKHFLELCQELKMEALVETHNAKEVERALKTSAGVIGINNRDLDSLKADLNTSIALLKEFPALKERIVVAESGIRTAEDVKALKQAGAKAILVGESLLKAQELSALISSFLGS